MKKALFMMVFLTSFLTTLHAGEDWGGYFPNPTPTGIPLSPCQGDDKDCIPKDRHAPARLPQLAYEGNTFVLAVPYVLEDVAIVVCGEDGTVLYYDVVLSITDYYMFLLSDDILADAFSVELYYGDRYLYGEL